MKLFLASSSDWATHQQTELCRLCGKETLDSVLVLNTAAVPYGLDPAPDWYQRQLAALMPIARSIDEVSLEDDIATPDSLAGYDCVYVSGGNTFYLAYRLVVTGWGEKLKNHIATGGVYAGSSAGAIILLDDISKFVPADNPAVAPVIAPGLGILEEAIIPHADQPKYSDIMRSIATELSAAGYRTIMLNDDQVYVVDGEERTII